MRNFICLLVCTCLTSWATAAEIFAWKVPLSHFAAEGLDTPGVVRLEAAPEKSPFFAEGDELWDIRAAAPDTISKSDLLPEWVIWNATSGRIVSKGSLIAINSLQYYMRIEDVPAYCHHRIDVFSVAEGGAPPDFSKEPDASLGIVVRSGNRSSSSFSENGAAIHFEGDTVFSEERSAIDMTINLSVALPECPKLKINTAATITDQTSIWVAREYDGKNGTDVRITSVIKVGDGAPYSELILRQENGSAVPLRVDRSFRKLDAIGDRGWLVSYWIGYENFSHLFNNELIGGDPFADDKPKRKIAKKAFSEVQAPGEFAPYFVGPIFNITEEVKNLGLDFKEGDFAGYDPLKERIFMFSSDKAEIEKFEMLFHGGGCGSPSNLIITARGNAQMRLIARSGQKAKLKSTRTEPKLTRDLEIEPTVGENNDLVDLRVLYEEKSGETLVRSLNLSIILAAGKFTELMQGGGPKGSAAKIELKAEVLEDR